jgi:glucan 1,3-beta-glucosidase
MMIRGVNIGGYLLLERYITPYQFLVTDCHVGLSLPPPQPTSSSSSSSSAPPYDFCWYPHQISAPPVDHPHYRECVLTTALATTTTNTTTTATTRNIADRVDDDDHSKRHEHTTVQQKHCTPVKVRNAFQNIDYPIDERTLALAFIQPVFLDNDNDTSSEQTGAATANSEIVDIPQQLQRAAAWLDYHLEYFITYDDLVRIQRAHMTHLRVPLPHWILYDPTSDQEEELWIIGKRWEYFLRLCRWARELQLQVWPDIHTAPGSQNGFGTCHYFLM